MSDFDFSHNPEKIVIRDLSGAVPLVLVGIERWEENGPIRNLMFAPAGMGFLHKVEEYQGNGNDGHVRSLPLTIGHPFESRFQAFDVAHEVFKMLAPISIHPEFILAVVRVFPTGSSDILLTLESKTHA